MQIINKSFEQFKKNAFQLAGVNLAYFIVAILIGLSLNFFIPIIGQFLYSVIFLISAVVYLRIFMQITNGESSICLNKTYENLLPVSGKLILLDIIKGIILAIVAIPSFMINIYILFSSNESFYYDIDSISMYLGVVLFTLLIMIAVIIIMELILGFVGFSIIDEDFSQMSFKDILVNGFKMMKGYRLKFILIQLVSAFLVLIGILMLGVGVLFTATLSNLLVLNLYKEAKESYIGNIFCNNDSIELNKDSSNNDTQLD